MVEAVHSRTTRQSTTRSNELPEKCAIAFHSLWYCESNTQAWARRFVSGLQVGLFIYFLNFFKASKYLKTNHDVVNSMHYKLIFFIQNTSGIYTQQKHKYADLVFARCNYFSLSKIVGFVLFAEPKIRGTWHWKFACLKCINLARSRYFLSNFWNVFQKSQNRLGGVCAPLQLFHKLKLVSLRKK